MLLGRSHTPTQRNTPSQRNALPPSTAKCVVALLGGRANCVVALLESTAICVIALLGGRAKTGAGSAIFALRKWGSRAKKQSEIAVSRAKKQRKRGAERSESEAERSEERAQRSAGTHDFGVAESPV
jgi:hypothetical protein